MNKFFSLKRFFRDRSGNILPTFAVLAFPLMFVIGAAIDYSDHSRKRNKLSNAADAAILAAAAEVNQSDYLDDEVAVKTKMLALIQNFLDANMDGVVRLDYQINELAYNPDTLAVELDIDYIHPTHIMHLAGVDEMGGKIETALTLSEDEQQSLSMYLVLDKSGSMASNGRMDALKSAVEEMTEDFEEKDPDHEFIRLGANAYSTTIGGSVSLDWGSSHVDVFTSNLNPGGGTNSSGAMAMAAGFLQGDAEAIIHEERNNSTPKKYILFMTDGNNNYPIADTNTLASCSSAKNDDVIIYTVAFQAPQGGQDLLAACASSAEHYFEADDASQLKDIFKKIGENAALALALTK